MAASTKQQSEITEDELYALASQGRDLRAEVQATGGDPDKEHEGGPLVDGDLTPEAVLLRSTGPEWNAHFAYAKSKGNTNKGSAVYADRQEEDKPVPGETPIDPLVAAAIGKAVADALKGGNDAS